MKIAASLSDLKQAPLAPRQGAEILEARLNLMGTDPAVQVQQCRQVCPLPVIATLRSGTREVPSSGIRRSGSGRSGR